MVRIKKKSFFIGLAIALIILITIVIGVIFYYKSVINSPLNTSDDSVIIEVNDGEGFNSLLSRLNEDGLIRNQLFVKLNLKLNDNVPKIIAGKYKVDKDVSLEQLIKILETEDITYNQISVTIPEGYDIDKIANEFEEQGLFTKEEFTQGIKEYPLPSYVKQNSKKKYNLEGYLYPDTYFFEKGANINDVISVMVKKFETVLKETEDESGKTLNDDQIETLIIKASLVEREVKLAKERATVASVIENRISKGMKLEFCSTVNYVIGNEGHEVLTYKDIEIDSPYNTYKYAGLPVGPIASPGKASIKAALNPETTDYLYFVLTEDNQSHHFSKTEAEHNAAKAEAEKKRKE
jgi:UPF0755 protein